jgi:uncharacterized protein YaaQ
MKLAIIIVQKEDSRKLEDALIFGKYQLTRFESFGGFLKKKNSTFFVGVEDEKLEKLLDLIKKTCRTRKEMVTSAMPFTPGLGETLITDGTKIQIGGAIIFVMEVEKLIKV